MDGVEWAMNEKVRDAVADITSMTQGRFCFLKNERMSGSGVT